MVSLEDTDIHQGRCGLQVNRNHRLFHNITTCSNMHNIPHSNLRIRSSHLFTLLLNSINLKAVDLCTERRCNNMLQWALWEMPAIPIWVVTLISLARAHNNSYTKVQLRNSQVCKDGHLALQARSKAGKHFEKIDFSRNIYIKISTA